MKSVAELGQRLGRVLELVVDVDEQLEVERIVRKARVAVRTKDRG